MSLDRIPSPPVALKIDEVSFVSRRARRFISTFALHLNGYLVNNLLFSYGGPQFLRSANLNHSYFSSGEIRPPNDEIIISESGISTKIEFRRGLAWQLTVYADNGERLHSSPLILYTVDEYLQGSLVGVLRQTAVLAISGAFFAVCAKGFDDSKLARDASSVVTQVLDVSYDYVVDATRKALQQMRRHEAILEQLSWIEVNMRGVPDVPLEREAGALKRVTPNSSHRVGS